MNLLIFLLAVLLFGGALASLYFAIVRPALLFWIRRSAVAVRDDLSLAILKREIGDHEKAVQPTAEKLDLLISGCEHIGITGVFIVARRDSNIKYEADRDAQTGTEAGAAMKDIIRRADTILVASLVLNSPFFWFVLPLIFAIGAVTGKISRWINSASLAGKGGSPRSHTGGLAAA